MTSDLNKGITSITYNHLNLPTQIYWAADKKIDYLYNAAGQKVKKTVRDGSNIKTTDYLDGFQYNNNLLEFFPHTEGYVKVTAMGINPNSPNYAYNYVFNYTDHLGNVRVSYTKDPQTGNLKILDESHYYPFGLKHQQYATLGLIESANQVIVAPIANNPYKYKYNGKEFQDELGLGLYDYHARNYDPALGRWHVIDPMAPKYFSHSPYVYALNNPVYFLDPDGMQVTNGDPEICEGCVVELEVAVITAKASEKSSSSSSSSGLAGIFNFGGSSSKSHTPNFWDGAYKNMLSPENKADYLKMQQAKREGEWFAVGVFGVVLAPAILPEIITFGSVKIISVKATISATAQLAVNHDIDAVDLLADTFLVPGVSGAVGGVADFKASEMELKINSDPNTILINSATSLISEGMGSRFNSAIKQMPTSATQTTAEIMIKTPHSMVEQGLNKSYEHRNK